MTLTLKKKRNDTFNRARGTPCKDGKAHMSNISYVQYNCFSTESGYAFLLHFLFLIQDQEYTSHVLNSFESSKQASENTQMFLCLFLMFNVAM